MSKKIEFASEHDHVELPAPAKKFIPEWYKKSPRWAGGKPTVTQDGKGIKHCLPFLDAMTAGYMVSLWQDIEVIKVGDDVNIIWGVSPEVAHVRKEKAMPNSSVPAGHSSIPFVWRLPISIKTPKGYSLLAVHPVNRFDLPFTTVAGLVDSDGAMHPGSAPFFIREDFEGIIPMGTPIMQLIPVKRNLWKSIENKALVEDAKIWAFISRRVVSGAYKTLKWNKKDFQ